MRRNRGGKVEKDAQDGSDDEGDGHATPVTDEEVDLVLKLELHSAEERRKADDGGGKLTL